MVVLRDGRVDPERSGRAGADGGGCVSLTGKEMEGKKLFRKCLLLCRCVWGAYRLPSWQ